MDKTYFMRKCDDCEDGPASNSSVCKQCILTMARDAATKYHIAYYDRLWQKFLQYLNTPEGAWRGIMWMGS